MRVRLLVAALVNSVFINVQRKYGNRGPPNKHGHTFYQPLISNYPHFIPNQFQVKSHRIQLSQKQ